MAIYYVDQTTGDDADTGLTEALAWKTIAKVNGESFSAGDSILFKKGEIWREQLTVPSAGSAGSPITFGAYGTGVDPIISGSDLFAWTNVAADGLYVKTGTYTGNATDDRSITGVGFQPDFVMIKSATNASQAVWKSSAHTGEVTSYFENLADIADNSIQAIGADGFTVGTHASVNTNALTYHYVAIKGAGSSYFKAGTYTGNGVNDRSITGVGFQPNFVIVKAATTQHGVWKSAALAGDTSITFSGGAVGADQIQAMEAGGFQVGTAGTVNTDTVLYYYVAMKTSTTYFETGSYTGNATDNRDIAFATGTFTPDFVMVKKDAVQGAVWTSDAVAADTSYTFGLYATYADMIQALNAGGFQIGANAAVNTNLSTYYYFAFCNATPGSGNVWYTTAAVDPLVGVWFNGTIGTEVAGTVNLDGASKFCYVGTTLSVYSATNPAAIVEAAQRDFTFRCKYKYITLENITFKHSKACAVYLIPDAGYDQTNCIVQDCTVHDHLRNGIGILNTNNADTHAIADFLITRNTVTYCGEAGIGFGRLCTTSTISYNLVHDCGLYEGDDWGWHGISLYGPSATIRPSYITIEYNEVYNQKKAQDATSPEGAGIQCDNNSDHCILRYNYSHDNEGQGIFLNITGNSEIYGNILTNNGSGELNSGGLLFTNSFNVNVYNNVIYGNDTYGIYIYDDTGNTTALVFKNNIIMNSSVRDFRVYYDTLLDYEAGVDFFSDYNCWYNASVSANFQWLESGTKTFAQFKALSSTDASSISGDPLMVDPANDNFKLQAGSPCIGTGIAVAVVTDFIGDSYSSTPNIGAYSNKTNEKVVQRHIAPLLAQ